MADGAGFEPAVPCGTHAFQACPIDRSGTHPDEVRILDSDGVCCKRNHVYALSVPVLARDQCRCARTQRMITATAMNASMLAGVADRRSLLLGSP
jgi:hypothetical protein